MNDPANPARRKLILGMMVLPVSGVAHAALPTPGASEGPFYPGTGMRFDDIDSDLVKISGQVEQAGGEIVRLEGRILDRQGKAVQSARVEIWQCDVRGRYLHPGDARWSGRDQAFQGFGFDLTNAEGGFSFRTIKPVPYPGRTPHIHLKILLAGRVRLTTQLYLADHPGNDRDWLYQRIAADQRGLVTMNFEKSAGEPVASVDLVI